MRHGDPIGKSQFNGSAVIRDKAIEALKGRDWTSYETLSRLTGINQLRFGLALRPLIEAGKLQSETRAHTRKDGRMCHRGKLFVRLP